MNPDLLTMCSVCHHQMLEDRAGSMDACPTCVATIGDVLVKAVTDDFDYAIGLRTGDVIRFTSAHYAGDNWIYLVGVDNWGDNSALLRNHREDHNNPCPRGLQVRVTDIVWAADAPNGS